MIKVGLSLSSNREREAEIVEQIAAGGLDRGGGVRPSHVFEYVLPAKRGARSRSLWIIEYGSHSLSRAVDTGLVADVPWLPVDLYECL